MGSDDMSKGDVMKFYTDELIIRLDERVDNLTKSIQCLADNLESSLHDIRTDMEASKSSYQQQFQNIDKRFEKVEMEASEAKGAVKMLKNLLGGSLAAIPVALAIIKLFSV